MLLVSGFPEICCVMLELCGKMGFSVFYAYRLLVLLLVVVLWLLLG